MPVRLLTGPNSFSWPMSCYKTGSTPNQSMVYVRKDGFRLLPGDRKNQVLQYQSDIGFGTVVSNPEPPKGSYPWSAQHSTPWAEWHNSHVSGNLQPWVRPTYNKAYDRFKQRAVGDSAQLGVAMAEFRESFGMIANRALQLRRAYKHLRRGEFNEFLQNIGVRRAKRKHKRPAFRKSLREGSHDVSGIWLEYWFGWSAMIGDMFSAVDVLTGSPPFRRVSGKAKVSRSITDYNSPVRENAERYWCDQEVTYKTGANVALTNPNLFLANQLGLVNPAAIAWELVPFSFVLDWFTGLGNVIESWTDYLGLSLTDTYETWFYRESNTRRYGNRTQVQGSGATVTSARLYHTYRYKGLITPTVVWPRFLNVATSKSRAASAVSLLVQLFISKK